MITIKGRPCGPLQSKKNPNAYTKPELVNIAVKKLGITQSKADSLTKENLCKSLAQNKLAIPAKKAPAKKAKLAKAKKAKIAVPKKAAAAKKTLKITKRTPPKKKAKISPIKPSPPPPKPKVKISAVPKPCVERSKLPLREHQIRVVAHTRKNRGLIVSHAVGSGKTLTAVTASQCFLEDTPNGKVIIVTPTSLQENFKKEMKAYGVSSKVMAEKYEFYTLQKFATTYNKKACGKNTMICIDEAHNLRTDVGPARASARKRALTSAKSPVVRADVAIRCAKTAGKVLLLTATSVYNNPRDIANLVGMVRGVEPLTKTEFEKMMDNPTAFNMYFRCVLSFYDIPADAAHEYPEVREHYVEIEMTDKFYKAYHAVENSVSEFFSETNPWRFLTGVRQASNALEECQKCDWVLARAKTGVKMVIYSAFLTFGVEQMQLLFKKAQIEYREVTGKMSAKNRNEAVKDYNSGKVNVLFITKAGGEGLDLKNTREVVIFESAWNENTEKQVIGRAARFRSHISLPADQRYVDVYHLIMTKPPRYNDDIPSADGMLREMIERKKKENSHFLKKLYPLSIEQSRC